MLTMQKPERDDAVPDFLTVSHRITPGSGPKVAVLDAGVAELLDLRLVLVDVELLHRDLLEIPSVQQYAAAAICPPVGSTTIWKPERRWHATRPCVAVAPCTAKVEEMEVVHILDVAQVVEEPPNTMTVSYVHHAVAGVRGGAVLADRPKKPDRWAPVPWPGTSPGCRRTRRQT